MTYVAKSQKELRTEGGSLAKKLATELALIDTELDALAAADLGIVTLTAGRIMVGNASNVATDMDVTGDVLLSDGGVTSINTGVIVNADISTNAAIAFSKLATLTSGNILVGSDASACTSVAMSGDATMNSSGVIRTAVVAEDSVNGGIPLTFMIGITASTDATLNVDVVSAYKIRVLDAHVILRGAGVGSETLTIQNAGNAITDAISVAGSDTAIVRAAQINDANYEISAGGTLRVASAGGASRPAALVVVNAVRVA